MQALGFINAFDELADSQLRLGRKVANYGLVSALLEHSTADELHFFLPFAAALQPFERAYAPFLEQPGAAGRVKLIHAASLPAALERGSYLAIHAAELDRYFPELCHLRNRWARAPFPVTSGTHSLSYWSSQVRNLYKVLPGPQKYDSVICTSRAAKGYVSACLESQANELTALGMANAGYAGRLDIVPLGVRARDFAQEDRQGARAKLGIEGSSLVLLCVGRLTQSDKFDLTPLLGIMALLAPKHDLHLVLAGARKGKYLDTLQSMAVEMGLAARLHLFPDFDSGLKPSLYAAADVFVSPADNLQETFGLTILEAMAAGLPVVASDFSGYRDLVVEGETGFLIPTLGPADYSPLDPARPILADHIAALQVAQRTALDLDIMLMRLEQLAGSPDLRARLGQAGRSRVRSLFDWKVVVARLEELWAELKSQAVATGVPQSVRDVCGAGLQNLFGHFTTGAIQPGQCLAPGPLARPFKQGIWANKALPDLADSLPPAGLLSLLQALEQRGGRASLSQLTADLEQGYPAYMVEHLALHGLKYGVLSKA